MCKCVVATVYKDASEDTGAGLLPLKCVVVYIDKSSCIAYEPISILFGQRVCLTRIERSHLYKSITGIKVTKIQHIFEDKM